MLEYRKLAFLSNEELARYDIIETHLACTAGMPDSEKIDQARCIEEIDKLAPWVRRYTKHCLAHPAPEDAVDSKAVVQMRALLTVLWKGAKLTYNPAKIPEDAPWELEDSFIHGALFGNGGTCATLPVIYTAIGRRLGYPLKLVTSWGPKFFHLFCRWDSPYGERFNIDASPTGTGFHPDEYYRLPGLDRKEEERGRFLVSQTPRDELSGFLCQRGFEWLRQGSRKLAVDAFALAAGACPENGVHLTTVNNQCHDWQTEVNPLKPPGFPDILLEVHQRRYPPGLPLRWEQDILCLQMMETVLKDPQMENDWWAGLRQGRRAIGTPRQMYLDSWEDRTTVRFQS